ncbi:MAG: hypothetical protein JWR18_117 [Segetibacter sp.]|jgi:hypothetical protein|nr:hypothetical protein [Segetibacter sp.]
MYQGRYKQRRTIKRIKQAIVACTLFSIMVISYFVFFQSEEVQPETIEFVDLAESHPAKAQSSDTTVVNTYTEIAGTPAVTKEADEPEVVAKKEEGTKSANRVEPKKSANQVEPKELSAANNVYKVKSRAHFYTQPNERTRRKAFINHWNNSYASIKPLDEKNDFVYVVFKNHLGQTSKGWLRKKDLQVAKPMYENNKE